jgi:hypothetical protein
MRVFLAAASALLLACATGVTDGETEFLGDGGFTGAGGRGDGGDDDVSSSTTPSSTSSNMGGTGGEGGAEPMCDFDAPNSCATAQSLGTLAGDSGSPSVSMMGETSMWFIVYIEEQDSNVFETDMSYTVTLTSPAGMDYDLVVHQGPQDGDPDCNATPIYGNGTTTQTVSSSWDDDQGFGGEDDSLYLNIFVEHVGGDLCDAPWTLTVQGHT